MRITRFVVISFLIHILLIWLVIRKDFITEFKSEKIEITIVTIPRNIPGNSKNSAVYKKSGFERFIPKFNINDKPSKSSGPLILSESEINALHEKEFKFYTYFARIHEKLDQYWFDLLREKMKRTYNYAHKTRVSYSVPRDLSTRCLIILNKDGYLTKILVLNSSGSDDFDDVALEAFRQASPFLNPPKDMIDPDGTIKILWDFIAHK